MSFTRVSVNGVSGIACGIGSGPNAGKRAFLADGANEIVWVLSADVVTL